MARAVRFSSWAASCLEFHTAVLAEWGASGQRKVIVTPRASQSFQLPHPRYVTPIHISMYTHLSIMEQAPTFVFCHDGPIVLRPCTKKNPLGCFCSLFVTGIRKVNSLLSSVLMRAGVNHRRHDPPFAEPLLSF